MNAYQKMVKLAVKFSKQYELAKGETADSTASIWYAVLSDICVQLDELPHLDQYSEEIESCKAKLSSLYSKLGEELGMDDDAITERKPSSMEEDEAPPSYIENMRTLELY